VGFVTRYFDARSNERSITAEKQLTNPLPLFLILIPQNGLECKQNYCSLFGYLKIKLRYNIRYSLDLELDAIWFRYPIDLVTRTQIVFTHDVNRDRHDQCSAIRAEGNWFDVLRHDEICGDMARLEQAISYHNQRWERKGRHIASLRSLFVCTETIN
jgi:hypothetical protein